MSKARIMFAFDHIPVGLDYTGAFLRAYSDYPWVAYSGNVATLGVMSDVDGVWLAMSAIYYPTTSNTYGGYWRAPFNTLYDVTQKRTWIGFRFKRTANVTPAAALPIVGTFTSAGAVVAAYLSIGDYSFTVGQAYYVEIMIDRVAGTRSVWVDGVLVVNAQAVTTTNSATDVFQFGNYAVSSGNNAPFTWQWKDLYFMDDPADGSVSRLGPIIAKPITIASAVGTGWTSSSGTIAAALATPVNTSTPTTPNVTSAIDGTPLVTGLSTTADPTALVQGVLLLGSGQRLAGTATVMRATLQDQATPTPNKQVLPDIVFPSGINQYGKTLAFLPNALDGGVWTAAKIAALTASFVTSPT